MNVTAQSPVLSLVSKSSRLLASSLDYRATVRSVAALLAEQLARVCTVELLDENGALERIAVAGDVRAETLTLPPSRVLDRLHDGPYESSAGKALTDDGEIYFLDVPLVAREQILGLLRLIDFELRLRDDDDLLLAEEIALRIALAVDGAQAVAREHLVADVLQRALLPETLPVGERQRYHAAYLPATKEAVVGGDWYDAFELPDGRVALSIGDVAGHGLQAATIMGEVRQAFRASAFDPKSPAAVLERANAILNMRAKPIMVTAIFGIYDPSSSRLTYATAGHPPPVLGLPDGLVVSLPTAGLPLGIGTDFESTDWTFTLPSGSLIVLYTDGLTEYGRDVIEGESTLLEAVAAEMGAPSENPARSLQRRILGTDRNTDDVATLTLSVTATRLETFDLTCSAIPLAAPLVRHALLDFANQAGLDDSVRFDLVTTVGEAVANAAEHAYAGRPGLVHITIRMERESLHVAIEDQGRWRPTMRRDERGRGLRLMRALSSAIQIHSNSTGTTIHLTLPRYKETAPA